MTCNIQIEAPVGRPDQPSLRYGSSDCLLASTDALEALIRQGTGPSAELANRGFFAPKAASMGSAVQPPYPVCTHTVSFPTSDPSHPSLHSAPADCAASVVLTVAVLYVWMVQHPPVATTGAPFSKTPLP